MFWFLFEQLILVTMSCCKLGMEGVSRPEANPYGPSVTPEEAPEAITQAVASLPPEQMFELMKQMKVKNFTSN